MKNPFRRRRKAPATRTITLDLAIDTTGFVESMNRAAAAAAQIGSRYQRWSAQLSRASRELYASDAWEAWREEIYRHRIAHERRLGLAYVRHLAAVSTSPDAEGAMMNTTSEPDDQPKPRQADRMKMSTRPQDWAPPARAHLFGLHTLNEAELERELMSAMTLTEFLLARIADREAKAYRYREVEPAPGRRFTWSLQGDIGGVDLVELRFEDGTRAGMSWLAFREQHMEQFLADPVLLAECEAKRRIVEEHGANQRHVDPCDAHDASFHTVPCDTLRFLALPYADHPDYREDWRP